LVAAAIVPSLASASTFRWLKITVFALLASNAAVFLASGTFSEALDSIAWLTLLASFELETGLGGRFIEQREAAVLRVARLVAAAAILAAAAGYVRDKEWLDAVNIGLWIAVVALLEIEVRYAGAVARHRPWFAVTAAAFYSGLATLVLFWLWQGEWFDAYDAALWLIAFITIELNVLQSLNREGSSPASPTQPG